MAALGANPETLILTQGSRTRYTVPSAHFVSNSRRKAHSKSTERRHPTGPRGTIRDHNRITKCCGTRRRRSRLPASGKAEDAIKQLKREPLYGEIPSPLLECFASPRGNDCASGKVFPSQGDHWVYLLTREQSLIEAPSVMEARRIRKAQRIQVRRRPRSLPPSCCKAPYRASHQAMDRAAGPFKVSRRRSSETWPVRLRLQLSIP